MNSIAHILRVGFVCFVGTLIVTGSPGWAQPKGGRVGEGGLVTGTAGRRMALVLGNKDYKHENKLKNPLNDAIDMTEALRRLGFEVGKPTLDADYRETMAAINDFVAKLQPSDVVFFYYSGHGIGFNGKNYLLPVDADVKCVERVDEHGVQLGRIMSLFEQKQVRTCFMFLDACRNMPDLKSCEASVRSITTQGLTKPTNNPRGSMIVFATEEGTTADDNLAGRNGLFTGELLKYLTTPGLGVRAIIDQTTEAVETLSANNGRRQQPARYDKLWGDFVFVIDASKPTAAILPPPVVVTPSASVVTTDLLVGGGAYKMGAGNRPYNEQPVHEVQVNGFRMARHEVTVDEWQTYCRALQRPMPIIPDTDLPLPESYWKGRERYPVTNVSWFEAVEYANWLSEQQGLRPAYQINDTDVIWDPSANGYRLPTEAEWEKAARGNSPDLLFAGSRFESEVGWNLDNSGQNTHPVGQKKPNDLNLYDLTGNVWEWCWDWYEEFFYRRSPKASPTGSEVGSIRAIRGGSWLTGNNAVSVRRGRSPRTQSTEIGFRLVRNDL